MMLSQTSNCNKRLFFSISSAPSSSAQRGATLVSALFFGGWRTKMLAHDMHEDAQIDGFAQQHTFFDAAVMQLVRRRAGNEDDRQVHGLGFFAQAMKNGAAVGAGHTQIQQHQVGREGFDSL